MSDNVGLPISVFFRYNDEQRQEILQCFRYSERPEDLINYLERGAEFYRFSAAFTAGAFGKRYRKAAKQLMKGAEQTISSLKNLSAELTSLGFTPLEPPERVLGELEAMRAAANCLVDLSNRGLFQSPGKVSSKKNKIDRRGFIEYAIFIWVTFSDDPALKPKTATKAMFDYLCAAVSPVLVGNDRFNSFHEAGRDALRKVVENICHEGPLFRPLFYRSLAEEAEGQKHIKWAKFVGDHIRQKGDVPREVLDAMAEEAEGNSRAP
jgi:hypothetical protein